MERAFNSALRIALIYLILGFCWIYFSDSALEPFANTNSAILTKLQNYKGWAYVSFTSILLFFLTYYSFRKIQRLQERDPLTQLLRNRPFKIYLDEMLEQAGPDQQTIIVLHLDINNFKTLVARVGRANTDAFLANWGKHLREHYKSDVLLSHLGQDEFGIALPLSDSSEKTRQTATDKLRQLFNNVAQQQNLKVTCSIGAALSPNDGDNADVLMAKANDALRVSRKSGLGRTNYFNTELAKRENEEFELLEDLLDAIDKNQLSLVYQPQFRLLDNSISGCEVLVRWSSKRHGDVSPNLFVQLAERHQVASLITDFVISRSSKELQEIGVDLLRLPRISINISAQEFTQKNFEKTLTASLKHAEPLRAILQLEITETAALSNIQASTLLMGHLKKQGLHFSIDDFGTGYSSFELIRELPIDELKIDRSFITHIATQTRSAVMVKSMIDLAHTFGLRALAEGVESLPQQQLLKEMGCDEAQGWQLAAPMAALDFQKFLSGIEQQA